MNNLIEIGIPTMIPAQRYIYFSSSLFSILSHEIQMAKMSRCFWREKIGVSDLFLS